MPTRLQSIFRARDLLGNPTPQSVSPHQLLRQAFVEEQGMINQAQNSSVPWAVGQYQLNYNPNQATYTIDASNFGKPLFVLRQTFNNIIPYVAVEFTDLDALNYGLLYTSSGTWGGIYPFSPTTEQMAFQRTGAVDQTYEVTVSPQPQGAVTYLITYLIGFQGYDDPLESEFMFPEHAHLYQLRLAASSLVYAEWYENMEQNMTRRKELAESFQYQMSRFEPAFDNYIRTITHGNSVYVDAWNG